METTIEPVHILIHEQWVHHNCGGQEVMVLCACGYQGTYARIGHGCADSEPQHSDLDALHQTLFLNGQENVNP